jgi:hypothetical protein
MKRSELRAGLQAAKAANFSVDEITIEAVVVDVEDLKDSERDLLEILEADIDKGIRSLHQMGLALIEIQKSRLYRQYGTFAQYCHDRWGLSEQRAYQLVSHANVIANLQSADSHLLPSSESQTRHLAKLSPEQQVKVWDMVVAETDKPTGAKVRSKVQSILPQAPFVAKQKEEEELPILDPQAEPQSQPQAIPAVVVETEVSESDTEPEFQEIILRAEGGLWKVLSCPKLAQIPKLAPLPLETLLRALANYYSFTPF